MKYVGADLHKKSISLCVVEVADGKRRVVRRQRYACQQVAAIREFFQALGAFRVAVEATASYEWFLLLVDDLADRAVLAHPKKLRVIAESTRKTDKIDAEVLATFLALDMLPESYRPAPRVRQHRVLLRHRQKLQGRITGVKCQLRHKLANYNADIADLFTDAGQEHLAKIALSVADRFEVQQLQEQWHLYERQLRQVDQELAKFAAAAPAAEQEAREVLDSIPQVGVVTIDVVLSELGDWRRFRSAKQVVAYARAGPGCARKRRQAARIAHWQGRIAIVALGDDRDRLAFRDAPGAVEGGVRAVGEEQRIQEESDRGTGSTPVVRDVFDVAIGPGVSFRSVVIESREA